ncbi:hypothetical protein [Micromonospora sediminicola]|uniref:hypothetical protein n=1 Tax=Micromonospora sediminicola TaxID=946078 RepID=UPI0037929314
MTWLGWCPGARATKVMLDAYQGTTVARIFVEAGKPLPAWDGPVLGPVVAAGVPVVWLSYKTNPPSDVAAWAGLKPPGMLLMLSEDHEPEQGPETGDPPLDDYHTQQAALMDVFEGHPLRDEILIGPIYTRYWWQKWAGDRRWMPKVRPDFVGWDIYNDGKTYRGADDLLSIPRAVAAELGVPYAVAELGAVQIAGDADGSGRSAWMRAMVDAVRADGGLAVAWFHKGGCDLMASGSETAMAAWQTLIVEEAAMATTAPQTLLDARRLLLTYLDINPGKVVDADLEPAEVGIVGDPAHRGGYHCGADRVVGNDYSVVESSRDRTGLSSFACALDIGQFEVTVGGRRYDLPHLSAWLVSQCAQGTADTRDVREVIYSLDGRTVVRWDRLGKRRTGDDSHRWHTHISYHRDAIKAGADQSAVFRRYLTEIGILEDDMANFTDKHAAVLDQLAAALPTLLSQTAYTDARMEAAANGRPVVRADLKGGGQPMWLVAQVQAVSTLLGKLPALIGAEGVNPTELAAALAALPKPGDVDEQAIVAGVLAGLPPEKIAAAIPAQLAQDVADELSRRLAT